MKINDNLLKEKIDKFCSSKKGKKIIKKAKINAIKNNKNSSAINSYKKMGDLFMDELELNVCLDVMSSKSLKNIVSLMRSKKGNYYVSKPEIVNDELVKVKIKFDEENLKRNSLLAMDSSGENYYTGKGIDNILALFNNGMDIPEEKMREMWDRGHNWESGYAAPYGLWETHDIMKRAWTHREPLNFMQFTAKNFKRRHGKDFKIKKVNISNKYKKGEK